MLKKPDTPKLPKLQRQRSLITLGHTQNHAAEPKLHRQRSQITFNQYQKQGGRKCWKTNRQGRTSQTMTESTEGTVRFDLI